jgi:hypothetical protein
MGVWGRSPQPGVPPLHPVLDLLCLLFKLVLTSIAIAIEVRTSNVIEILCQ